MLSPEDKSFVEGFAWITKTDHEERLIAIIRKQSQALEWVDQGLEHIIGTDEDRSQAEYLRKGLAKQLMGAE